MSDWPVQFIIDDAGWQRGYDAAMQRHRDNQPLHNPYSPNKAEFCGFEEGRADAEKLNHVDD
jgi:hypothetical protein